MENENFDGIKYVKNIRKEKDQRRISDCCNIQDGALCDNCYYKELHLGCCSSPRSASENPDM